MAEDEPAVSETAGGTGVGGSRTEEEDVMKSRPHPLASDSQSSISSRSDIDALTNGIGKPDVDLESGTAVGDLLPDEGGIGAKMSVMDVSEKGFVRQNSDRGAGEGGRGEAVGDQVGEKGQEATEIQEPLVMPLAVSPNGRFNKFDIEIGRGSFKTVYKGLDTEKGVAVAWCELQENRYNKAEQARFKEEVAILKTLQHPNILRLYDTWEVRGGGGTEKRDSKVLVLITELMTSGTLKTYMRRFRPKLKVIRSWGRQILRGLLFLHTRTPPIIHRDLKCDNIFINGTTGLVKIGDLGLATLKRSDVKTVIGTPEFMAPEMYEENYDESVDVYAFGMCLLEMVTLEYPYMECKNPAQIYKKVTSGTPPLSLEKVKDADLRRMIIHCTCVDKGQRYKVKDLIQHEFFAEDGMNVDVTQSEESPDKLVIRMMVTGDTKKKNGEEAIEFPYDLKRDNAEEVVGEMVKTGVLRSEQQKMALRTIKETMEAELHKRNKERDKDKERLERLQTQQSTAMPVEPVVMDGDPATGITTKTSRQPSNPDLVGQMEVKERSQTPALPVATAASTEPKKQTESISATTTTSAAAIPPAGSKPTLETLTSSSMTGLISSSTSSAPPSATPSSSSTLNPPTFTPLPPAENLGSQPHPTEAPQNEVTAGATPGVVEKADISKEPVTEPAVKQVTTALVEAVGSNLESTSTPALVSNCPGTSVTIPEDPVPSPLPSHDPEQATPSIPETTLSQPAGEKAGPVVTAKPLTDDPAQHTQGGTTAVTAPVGVVGGSGATNGSKKKGSRGKGKMTLSLVEVTPDDVVKCVLVTKNEVRINFQFSRKFDETKAIFKKLMHAGHLKEAEEENFVQQAEKIVLMTKSKNGPGTTATTDPLLETKPSKTESLVQVSGETSSAKTSPLTPRVGTRAGQAQKSSPANGDSSQRGELTSSSGSSLSGGGPATARPQAKVVSEVTGEVLPFVASEPTTTTQQPPSLVKNDTDKERPPGRAPEVSQRPLTRDVATGMSPATGLAVVLGEQNVASGCSVTGDESAGKKGDSPPSLSTQTSNESVSGSAQPSPPVLASPSPSPGLMASQSGPSKTTSLPAGCTNTAGISSTSFEVCSVSEPVCPTSTDSQSAMFTPSTQRRFVVADVAEENDSPDELSAQGSTDSLPQQGDAPVEIVDPVVCRSATGEAGASVEVIVVSSAAAPDSTGQREEEVIVTRPPLMSAPSYSSAVTDPAGAQRQRSTSLPHKLNSAAGQTSLAPPTSGGVAAEKVGMVQPGTMPVIPESSLTSETSDVFSADPPPNQPPSSIAITTSQSSNSTQIQQPHPNVKPHPPPVNHSPSPQPQTPPNVRFSDISHRQSEMLSNAFMYFIFSMNQMLKDPAIQPLVHHLEEVYGESHPSSEAAPPTSPSSSNSCQFGGVRQDEDSDLKRRVEDLEHQLQETKRQLVERQRERQLQNQQTAASNLAPLSSPVPVTTTPRPSSVSREASTSPAPPGKVSEERGKEEAAPSHVTSQAMAQRDRMEQKVRNAIFSVPLQLPSQSVHVFPTAGSGPTPVSFHSSYHGETAEQLRNRPRQSWDISRRYSPSNSYAGLCSTTSSSRSAYPQTYVPPSIHSPTPPHFVHSPSTPHPSPQLPTVTTSPPSLQHQSTSQEWTEYTSADVVQRGSTPFPTPAPTNQGSSSSQTGPDISEFDPIHS